MKGFNYPLGEFIRKGLRTDRTNVRNTPGCVECFNLKPHIVGLRGYEILTNPVSTYAVKWPYPQIVLTSLNRFMLEANAIYSASTDWTPTLSMSSIAGDLWDVVDFGDYVIFCNGERIVIRDADGAFTSNAYLSTMPLALTMCNFKGQLIAGNIISTWYNCNDGFVAWGAIGSTDMTPDGSNVAGFRPMPWKGSVRKVMRLGDVVVVYCENGVGFLSPFNQTFGFKEMLGVGVPCKGAVGGDETTHVFVDNENYLWQVNSDLKMQRLGYQEFIESMQSDSLVVSLNPAAREFHISDGVHCYLLTPYGLCKVYQRATSVVKDGTNRYGVFIDDGSDEDTEAIVVSDTLDFNTRGMKTLESLEFGLSFNDYEEMAYGAVDYSYNSDGFYTRSDWKRLNPEGQCSPLITAPDMRVAFKVSDFTEVQLDSVGVAIKYPDRRFRRGTYAVEAPTRSS